MMIRYLLLPDTRGIGWRSSVSGSRSVQSLVEEKGCVSNVLTTVTSSSNYYLLTVRTINRNNA